jgi:hypothetical protein
MEVDRLIGSSKRLRRVRSIESEVRQTWVVSTIPQSGAVT